jgi:peptidyl-prolyl cis-trans isomerase B (cyclophilin B)
MLSSTIYSAPFKSKILPFLIAFFILSFNNNPMAISQSTILLETTEGNIKILLYDETPNHRDNFLKLVKDGFYDSLLFHRCIANFMIQTGDPESQHANADQPLGTGGPSYKLPAEFLQKYFHKKGAIAAARQGDAVNPEKKSSGSQFYIVQGAKLSDSQLDALENSKQHLPFTPQQRQVYTTLGGTPHLDNTYTVFGEVTEGLEVVDKIASSPTGQRNRPVKDIRIIHATVIH